MKQAGIKFLLESGQLRIRSSDSFKADSLVRSALDSASFSKIPPLNEKTATGIFKALYDAFHALGDAKWWKLGYEACSHEASMKILMNADIKAKFRLQDIDNYRKIRNNAVYRGHLVSVEQTKRLMALWDELSGELIEWVRK
ncbi:hypothetical protein HY640_04055 [Candidatus Woesearchaeota archaeon]|nr:hypothetical protein [Candidatus Woesearchaeota archaeon]